MNSYSDDLRSKLRVFNWANIIYTSALTGQRISKILDASYEASVIHKKRLTTATLNAVVQEALWKAPQPRRTKGEIITLRRSTADVCVFLQRPEAVLRHVQEVHGKAVEKNIDSTGRLLACCVRKSKGGGLTKEKSNTVKVP